MISIVVGHATLDKAFLSYLFGRIVLLSMILGKIWTNSCCYHWATSIQAQVVKVFSKHEHLQFLFLFIRKLLHVVRSQSELCYSFLFSQFLLFFFIPGFCKRKKNTRRCQSPNKKLICSHLLDGSWWKRSSFSLVYIVPIVNIETRGFKHLPGFTCILSQPSVFLQNLINPYCLISPIEPLSDQ